jgi:PAS domain-containing protein
LPSSNLRRPISARDATTTNSERTRRSHLRSPRRGVNERQAELLGEHVSLLLDDNSTTEEPLRNPAGSGERSEFTVQTAEGDRVRCEVRPLLEGDGTVQGTVGIVHEIIDRRRPDQSLGEPDQPLGESNQQRDREPTSEGDGERRETKPRLEVAASAGLVGTWTWDVRGDVVTADEYLAESHGMDPAAAAADVPVEEFVASIHEGDRERVRKRLAEAVEETGEFEAEYRVTNADGDTLWVESRGEVEYDGNG